MGPNKYNIGDIVQITTKFRVVGIGVENDDVYYTLVPYEESYKSDIRRVLMNEKNIHGIAGKFPWGKGGPSSYE